MSRQMGFWRWVPGNCHWRHLLRLHVFFPRCSSEKHCHKQRRHNKHHRSYAFDAQNRYPLDSNAAVGLYSQASIFRRICACLLRLFHKLSLVSLDLSLELRLKSRDTRDGLPIINNLRVINRLASLDLHRQNFLQNDFQRLTARP